MSAHHARRGGGGEVHEHDLGLAHDMTVMLSRRRALTFLGVAGAATVAAGCAAATNGTTATSGASTTTAAAATAAAIAQETAGPYPGDGSNGPNVLIESGVVRRDITGSFGSYSGVAHGVPMKIELMLQDLAKSGAAGSGMAVYLWHCDRDGKYSLYSDGVTTQNYLRGVQVADATGKVTFESVFPGCYSGRWTHIHFEVYDSLAVAVAGDNARLTSQIALPQDACAAVYAYDSGYAKSIPNLATTSLASDNVFGDGWDAELASVSGAPASGMSVALTVGVAEKSANTRSDGGPGRPPGGPGGPPPQGR